MTSIKNPGRYLAQFPASRYDKTSVFAKDFRIVQSARAHDMAVIRMVSRTIDWQNVLASSAPVRITWQSTNVDETKGEFVGYVTHVKPVIQAHESNYSFEVYAVSASRVFRQTSQEAWRNKRMTDVVADIGKKAGMNAVVRAHPMKRSQIILGGASQWEFMAELSETLGYGLTTRGTNLLFMPITDLIDVEFESAPVISSLVSGRSTKGPKLRLESFTMNSGVTRETRDSYSNDAVNVVSVNPVNGQVSSARRSPGSAVKRRKKVTSPYVEYSRSVAHSKSEADLLAASGAENGLMALDAKITCSGSAALKPYMPVYIEGRNDQMTGWWIVKSVTHLMDKDNGQYLCEAIISTDSLAASAIPPASTLRKRNFGKEIAKGWSSRGLKRSRLREMQPVKTRGKTSDNFDAFRWVSL